MARISKFENLPYVGWMEGFSRGVSSGCQLLRHSYRHLPGAITRPGPCEGTRPVSSGAFGSLRDQRFHISWRSEKPRTGLAPLCPSKTPTMVRSLFGDADYCPVMGWLHIPAFYLQGWTTLSPWQFLLVEVGVVFVNGGGKHLTVQHSRPLLKDSIALAFGRKDEAPGCPINVVLEIRIHLPSSVIAPN